MLRALSDFSLRGQVAWLGLIWIIFYFLSHTLARVHRDELLSLAWTRRHKVRVYFFFRFIPLVIVAPAFEELAYRAILAGTFQRLTWGAWVAIVISAAIFSYDHLPGVKARPGEIRRAALGGEDLAPTDDPVEAMARARQSLGNVEQKRRAKQAGMALALGLLLGGLTVGMQSLIIPFAIHATWNLIAPPVFSAFRRLRARSPENCGAVSAP
jgi:membrane protease YdiL (CAAX protease family)